MNSKINIKAFSFLTFCLVLFTATFVHSTVIPRRNLADLIILSENIFVGKVVSMTDYYEEGQIPYTEFTFEVSDTIKGNVPKSGTFSYRQAGLLKPRDAGNGMKIAFVLDGFPRYQIGEKVMIFLRKPSRETGLTSPAGLRQGKFLIVNGMIFNELDNSDLFYNMTVKQATLTPKESKQFEGILSSKSGPVDAQSFINMVSKAVSENLFDTANPLK